MFDNVATNGYIGVMKRKMRPKARHADGSRVLETTATYGTPLQINVRTAKDQLSRFLDLAAGGEEVVITSDGRPKARLIGYHRDRKRFKVDWKRLKAMPIMGPGNSAEEIIRKERDSRF